ncbi:cytochrome b [Variovorax sp. J22R115]|uniref:cytochrome b n=1 Tax=Variovorax sp. J22R115 TaxID=3053509 RepID=UPI002575723B|nr:cytochrome b [Variovorax sp. J22R115]MDM0048185.1 cytochrome b [Variovorax sp. J22R115]
MRTPPSSAPSGKAKTDAAWSASIRLFHWLIAVLIFIQFAMGWLAVGWRLSPTKINLFVWHKSIGMLILALVIARLLNRLARPTPPLPADTPAWERAAARWSHALLYVLMIAMPLTGWVINSAAGIPFRIFWQLPLPALIAPDKHTAEVVALVHFALGIALVALLMLHIGAALRHHFVKRNNVLRRMLPSRRLVK